MSFNRSAWHIALALAVSACTKSAKTTTPRDMPMPSVQVGACGQPGVDGVVGKSPKIERWDRDLDGDGVDELVVVDRSMCSDGNCYWNVFRPPAAGTSECSRYAGTFAAAALEPLAGKGEDNMQDIRGYWHLHGGRLLLQSYRFVRGGYQLVDALLCRRAADDKLECTDSER
ncbi:MAG: hypothetical protein SFX73_10125 [Kofleriaceae bacterium]|nr:hypothetical protein [Kofleriaceae bacterium]